MASIIIRKLDETVKKRLRLAAARHGRSMEEEAREILKAALRAAPAQKPSLAESIRKRVEPFGGIELLLPRREPVRHPPELRR
jgi:plasmid stability protein